MTTKKPLLSLDTVEPDRETILIDGQDYELAASTDFDLVELTRMERLRAVADTIRRKTPDEITDSDASSMRDVLIGMVRMIVRGASDEHLAKLNDPQRMAIVQVFTQANPTGATATATATAPATDSPEPETMPAPVA